MPKFGLIELQPGERYGRLTAVRLDHIGYNGRYRVPYYLFKCDCGKEKIINVYNVRTGNVKSCGCLKKETALKKIHKAWEAHRKHVGCMECGADDHYAKGLCRNCYNKHLRHNFDWDWDYKEPTKEEKPKETLEKEKKRVKPVVDDLLVECEEQDIAYWQNKILEAKTSNEISRCLYDIRHAV